MSEVEKMYENAGVKKLLYCDICNAQEHALGLCAETKCEPFYPQFSAEKQIAILIFILNKFGDIGFQKMYSITGNDESTRKDFIKCLCDCEHETWDSRPVDFYYQKGASGDTLKESLAGLINYLWQDLTAKERTEITDILRG